MSPAMRAMSISDGWGDARPKTPGLKGSDPWRSATPFSPSKGAASSFDDNNNGDGAWGDDDGSVEPCKAFLMGDTCTGWCGGAHPPASEDELYFPEHADVKDILVVLGLPDSSKPNIGHVRQTADKKEKERTLAQAHLDFLVPALSAKAKEDNKYTEEEFAKMKKHLKTVLMKLDFKP